MLTQNLPIDVPVTERGQLRVHQVELQPLFGIGYQFVGHNNTHVQVVGYDTTRTGNLLRPLYKVKLNDVVYSGVDEQLIVQRIGGFVHLQDKQVLAHMWLGEKYSSSVQVKIQWSAKAKAPVCVVPGVWNKDKNRFEPMVAWFDEFAKDCSRWVQAGLVRLWAILAGFNVSEPGAPGIYIYDKIQVSCRNCQAYRSFRGSDTTEGDSDAQVASFGTTTIKDNGPYAYNNVCSITGKCPGQTSVVSANIEAMRGEQTNHGKLAREALMDEASACRMYTYNGSEGEKSWLIKPGSLPVNECLTSKGLRELTIATASFDIHYVQSVDKFDIEYNVNNR